MLPAPALADYSAREYAAPAGETEPPAAPMQASQPEMPIQQASPAGPVLDWLALCRPLSQHFESCYLTAYPDPASPLGKALQARGIWYRVLGGMPIPADPALRALQYWQRADAARRLPEPDQRARRQPGRRARHTRLRTAARRVCRRVEATDTELPLDGPAATALEWGSDRQIVGGATSVGAPLT